MPKYYFTGDILHPGRVVVNAPTLEKALEKLGNDDFEVFDETDRHLSFAWNGDEDAVDVEA